MGLALYWEMGDPVVEVPNGCDAHVESELKDSLRYNVAPINSRIPAGCEGGERASI